MGPYWTSSLESGIHLDRADEDVRPEPWQHPTMVSKGGHKTGETTNTGPFKAIKKEIKRNLRFKECEYLQNSTVKEVSEKVRQKNVVDTSTTNENTSESNVNSNIGIHSGHLDGNRRINSTPIMLSDENKRTFDEIEASPKSVQRDKTKNIRIFTHNVRGFTDYKQEMLLNFAKYSKYDVMAFTETSVNNVKLKEIIKNSNQLEKLLIPHLLQGIEEME